MVILKTRMKVGPKGQVVIPQEFRRKLNIKAGSTVLIGYADNGVTIEKPIEDPIAVFREIAKKGPQVSKINSDKDYDEMMEERWKKST